MEAKDPYLAPILSDFQKRISLLPKRVVDRIEEFLSVLSTDQINVQTLKEKCFNSIPDDIFGLRSMCWKLILGYLPPSRSDWPTTLASWRKNYAGFVAEFLMRTPEDPEGKLKEAGKSNSASKKEALKMSLVAADDHPLSRAVNSVWAEFFEDHELWEMVEKDTKRTRAEMDFFQKPTQRADKSFSAHKFINLTKKQSNLYDTDEETHNEVLQRILYIYAKLNKGISYVQGMNELLAPIYYCFSKDPNPAFADHAEADAFWCFTTLMAEIKDSFVRSLDSAENGIKSRVNKVHALLKHVDDELWMHFERQGVNPMYYCMRWLMLFLTQEFELGEVLTLWDSLLSHDQKLIFLDCICVAVIVAKREALLAGEFADILEGLRKIDNINLFETLQKANELHEETYGGVERKNSKKSPTMIPVKDSDLADS